MRRLAWLWALALAVPGLANAAAATITISPPIQQITIPENQSSVDSKLTLTNNTSKSQQLRLQTVDFGTLDDTGGLYFIGRSNDFTKKYGLAKWLKLESDSLTLGPGQTKTLKVTILNESSLAPGGHYAAVVLNPNRDKPDDSSNIGVQPVLTQLLFVRKVGGLREDLLLAGADLPKTSYTMPHSFVLHFKNNGNVHIVPRGIVKIYDPRGKLVSSGTINEDSSLVLPESYRKSTVELIRRGLALVPGKYRVVVDYRFDGNDNFTRAEYDFRLINLPVLGGLLVILLLIAATVWQGLALYRRRRMAKR